MEINKDSVDALFAKAKSDMIADMKSRGIGAILWNNTTAGFQYIPVVVCHSKKDPSKTRDATIMGLYRYNDMLYLIEEDRVPFSFDDFWNQDIEAAPTVITLTEDIARKDLGDPETVKGFTTQGTLEEWTAIADCYFQALTED